MPKATSFKALGAGNGFGGCLGKVDVSVYDNWVALTLEQAMHLYWDLSGAGASFTSSISESRSSSQTPASNYSWSFAKNETSLYTMSPEPKERVSGSLSINPTHVSKQFTQAEYNQSNGAACGGTATFSVPAIKKMYNGDINDESKFVGYGIASLYSASTIFGHNEGILSGSAVIQIGSYLDGNSESGQSGPDPQGDPSVSYYNRTASIITIGGMKFRSFASASVSTNSAANLSKTVTSSASSASASGSWAFSGSTSSSNSSGSAGVSAPSSLDFYTYST